MASPAPLLYLDSMSTFLADVATSRLERCVRAIRKVKRSPDTRRIHGLRVTLKRLRTLLRLLRSMAPDARRPAGALRRLRAVFAAAGRVRDAQLLMAWARDERIFTGRLAKAHQAHLDHRASKALRALSRSIAALDAKDVRRIGRYIDRVTSARTAAQASRAAERYIRNELRAAAQALAGDQKPHTLHDVRKHVKHAYNVSRMLEEATVATRAQRLRCERIDGVQDRLGAWQDLFIRWEHLCAWRKGGRPARHEAAILERRIEQQRARLTRSSRAVLTGFLR